MLRVPADLALALAGLDLAGLALAEADLADAFKAWVGVANEGSDVADRASSD